MKKFSYILLVFLLVTCSKEDEEVKTSPYIGGYKIISLTSNIPLDLNRDGIATTNFLEELRYLYYYQFMCETCHPALIIGSSSNPNLNDKPKQNYLLDYTPRQHVNSQDINDIDFGAAPYFTSIFYNNEFTQVVNLTRFYDDAFIINQKLVFVYEVILMENNKVKVKSTQQYFTVETGWKTCHLEGLYEKK